jgi:hypothetical protein
MSKTYIRRLPPNSPGAANGTPAWITQDRPMSSDSGSGTPRENGTGGSDEAAGARQSTGEGTMSNGGDQPQKSGS